MKREDAIKVMLLAEVAHGVLNDAVPYLDDIRAHDVHVIQTLLSSLSDSVQKAGRVPNERQPVYRNAFPRATQRHL